MSVHFDTHLTTMVRDAGKPLLFLWQWLASYAIWIFILSTIALAFVDQAFFWFIVIPVMTTQGVALLLQMMIRRDRPPLSVASIVMWTRTPSFPSAHAATSMAFALTIATIVLPYGNWGIFAATMFCVLAVAIALARVMVGVHFLSDIIVGMVVGALVVAVMSTGLG